MAGFLLTFVTALMVAAVGYAIIAFTLGRTPGLSEPVPDGVFDSLPGDRALTSTDIAHVRFDMGVRGYRMAQVDQVLTRVRHELADANARVAELELQLYRLRHTLNPPQPALAGGDESLIAGEEGSQQRVYLARPVERVADHMSAEESQQARPATGEHAGDDEPEPTQQLGTDRLEGDEERPH